MGHDLLSRPLTPQEFDSMMSELDEALAWMIEQLRQRPQTALESACDSAKLGAECLEVPRSSRGCKGASRSRRKPVI